MKNNWKELEHIVRLIEQSISPDSVVDHNVNLPVIGSQIGATRQCDVVIRFGQKPRETISIVEVQNRISKPDINTFGGWLDKLEAVGAQHLICVSHHDFPASIKEKAFKLGNTVRLITLKELDAEDIPINVVFNYQGFDVKALKEVNLITSKSEAEALGIRDIIANKFKEDCKLNANEQCWSLDKKELVPLFILCRDFIVRHKGENEGEGRITFNEKKGPKLYMFVGGHFLRVGLDCVFLWTCEEIEKPISVLSYEQNEDGVLAWFAEVSFQSERGPLSTKFPFVKTDEGYRIDSIFVCLPKDMELSLKAHRQ